MKKVLYLVFMVGILGVSAFAYAQYDPNFVGPQQQQADPFAQNGTGQTARCGPQSDGGYILCEDTGGLIQQRQTNFAAFLRELYILAFILAGTVAFVRIVYGGILYSWSGVVDRKKEAIGVFKSVAVGMALLMGSYLILNTINPALTVLSLPNVWQGTVRTVPNAIQPNMGNTPMTPEMNATLERAAREMNGDIELTQGQIDELNAKENRTAADNTRLKELNANLIKIQSTLKGVEYNININTKPSGLDGVMTSEDMKKAMQVKP